MAQIVQAHRADAGGGAQLAEPLGDRVERQRVAVLAGEHEAVVDVGGTPCRALGILGEPVREQHPDGAAVELDDAVLATGGLRLAEHVALVHPVAPRAPLPAGLRNVDLDELLADDEHAGGKVDIVPAQPACLPAAQAGAGDQLEQGAEPVTPDRVEELAELGWLPRPHLRPRGRW
ncbi:MAG TPA: hypothetical protein VM367_09605 [Pseudonocardia sp.]|nr:hypothetical protein [Pseudonocardia sp.]